MNGDLRKEVPVLISILILAYVGSQYPPAYICGLMAKSRMRYILLFAFFAGTTGLLRGQSAPDTLKTATLQVTGITCQGDMPIIKKKLINQEGIDEVTFTEAKGGSSTFTVLYHTSVTSEQHLLAIIESSPSCDNPNAFPYAAKPAKAKKKRD